MMGEFDLIRRFFQHRLVRPEVALGNGDDAALLSPAPGHQLAVSTDMLVEGRHFLPTVDPAALGYKALAVNLSDLAAMGARPLAFTLALALPRVDEPWLSAFADGLLTLADAHGCALIGGDTTSGPLNLCITVMGDVPLQTALRRDAAQDGDDLYVSGRLGDARLAIEGLRGTVQLAPDASVRVTERLERPEPRVALGMALRGVGRACADVSDGLLGDLGHILRASRVSAVIDVDALMQSAAVSDDVRTLPRALAMTCVLAGGDDYELVFTAPASARQAVADAAVTAGTPVTRVGQVTASSDGLYRASLVDATGQPAVLPDGVQLQGFDHFA